MRIPQSFIQRLTAGTIGAMVLLLGSVLTHPGISAAELYSNGPLVTHPGEGFGGADASAVQSDLDLTTHGFNVSKAADLRLADDFEVPAGGWHVGSITFYVYVIGGGSTPPFAIDHVNLQIWDGPPGEAGSSVVWGDDNTNLLKDVEFSNIYRVSDKRDSNLIASNRPVMAVTASVDHVLAEGTYWLDWQVDGDGEDKFFTPPVTILGQVQKSGANGLQYTNGRWERALDSGTVTPHDFPFTIHEGQGAADITLTKQASQQTPVVGDDVTFTLAASNGTDADAVNVQVTDSLPAGLDYVSNSCGASFAAGTLSWDVGDLSAGDAQSCELTVTVLHVGQIVNTAALLIDGSTMADAAAAITAQAAPASGADLALSKTADAETAEVGDLVSYTLAVTNNGPDSASGVSVSDSLPAQLDYVSNSCGAAFSGNTLTWAVGSLANGATQNCELVAEVADAGVIVNAAVVTADTDDPNPANNRASATIRAGGASVAPIPTLGQWTLILMMLLLAGVGARELGWRRGQ